VETRRWEGARSGPTSFWVEAGAMGMPDVDVDSRKSASLSLPSLLLVALFSGGSLCRRVEVACAVVSDFKLLKLLKYDVLLGMPEGVGSRDCV